jgi:hypothetical protein
MTDIIIPSEAVEAGAKALCKEARLFWPDLNDAEHDIMRAEARAAFLAMLENWPGVYRTHSTPQIILPLPQENSDDQ